MEASGAGAPAAEVARSSVRRGAGATPAWNEQFIFGVEAEAVGAADLKIQLVDWGGGGGGSSGSGSGGGSSSGSRIVGYIPRIPISEMAKRRQVVRRRRRRSARESADLEGPLKDGG